MANQSETLKILRKGRNVLGWVHIHGSENDGEYIKVSKTDMIRRVRIYGEQDYDVRLSEDGNAYIN